MPEPRIFLSYSHLDPDQNWVQEFARSLSQLGLALWFDQYNIRAGDSLAEAIEKGLRECDLLVVVVSPENIRRPNLFFEIGAAVGMGKRVIPIVPENFDLSQLPFPLRLKKFLIKRSPQATAEELAAETGALQAA